MSQARLFHGDAMLDMLPALDLAAHRGIAYGDGLFETMRVHRGDVHWWPRHWARLHNGAQRLGIALPERTRVEAQWRQLLAGTDAGTLKLLVHRGGVARGYAPEPHASPLWQLQLSAPPPAPDPAGLLLRWCALRLARQPALAGIKHCNRLEQVLARQEWVGLDAAGQADDGLLCDVDDQVVCAISANLFIHDGHGWMTPSVDDCGVAGVCRGWAIGALRAREVRLSRTDVEMAQAIFLCNALRGILPVRGLAGRQWSPPHPAVVQACGLLAHEHPAFSME